MCKFIVDVAVVNSFDNTTEVEETYLCETLAEAVLCVNELGDAWEVRDPRNPYVIEREINPASAVREFQAIEAFSHAERRF